MTEDEKKFVLDHLHDDVSTLLLNPPKEHRERTRFLVDQILSRQKAMGKLDDWVRNADLIMPPPLSVEQSSSLLTADYKKSLLHGKTLIDLTGGMGVDCLSLSENFDRSIYVEKDPHLCELFGGNCRVLGKQIQIENKTAEAFLSDSVFNDACYFIDPARRDDHGRKVFRLGECSPDMTVLLPLLRQQAAKLLIKTSPLIDLKQGIRELNGVTEVHVISVKNECKEILFFIDFNHPLTDDPPIEAVELGSHSFSFKLSKEARTSATYSACKQILLIPNASVLKAGAFKSVSSEYTLDKLARNTHIYTSNQPLAKFPGRQFEVLVIRPSKTELKPYQAKGINVITRNYPLSPNQLIRKLQIKEGGSDFLIGFRDKDEKPTLVLARKIKIDQTELKA